MSEILRGKIGAITFQKKSPKGWSTYEVLFTEGRTFKLTVAPDGNTPGVGDEVEVKPALYGTYQIVSGERNAAPQSGNTSSTGGEAKVTYGKSDKDDYWTQKAKYEETVRDPKIEFQAYAGLAVNIYAAGLPFLDEKPNSAEELDHYFQLALDKAQNVVDKINKK